MSRTACALLAMQLAAIVAFVPLSRHHQRYPSSSLPLQMAAAALSPRKALFFEIVESGLKDRFPQADDVARVWQFCRYAKGEAKPPSPQVRMHDPCEEYIDGLAANAWWDTAHPAFEPWLPALEARCGEIQAELAAVLAQQELFKGDSRYQVRVM